MTSANSSLGGTEHVRARQGKLGGDIHAVEAAFAAVRAGRMLAGGEGGEVLEVAFDSDVCASDGGPQSAEKSAHLRIRHAPQARSEREGERERAKGAGRGTHRCTAALWTWAGRGPCGTCWDRARWTLSGRAGRERSWTTCAAAQTGRWVAGSGREGRGEEEKGFIEDGYGRGRATSKGGRTKRKEDWRGRAVEKTG